MLKLAKEQVRTGQSTLHDFYDAIRELETRMGLLEGKVIGLGYLGKDKPKLEAKHEALPKRKAKPKKEK